MSVRWLAIFIFVLSHLLSFCFSLSLPIFLSLLLIQIRIVPSPNDIICIDCSTTCTHCTSHIEEENRLSCAINRKFITIDGIELCASSRFVFFVSIFSYRTQQMRKRMDLIFLLLYNCNWWPSSSSSSAPFRFFGKNRWPLNLYVDCYCYYAFMHVQ